MRRSIVLCSLLALPLSLSIVPSGVEVARLDLASRAEAWAREIPPGAGGDQCQARALHAPQPARLRGRSALLRPMVSADGARRGPYQQAIVSVPTDPGETLAGIVDGDGFVELPDGRVWCEGRACVRFRCVVAPDTLAPIDHPACASLRAPVECSDRRRPLVWRRLPGVECSREID